jgi:putative transposase
MDRDGAPYLLAPLIDVYPRLRLIWADAGYRGKCVAWMQEALVVKVEIVKHWWTGIGTVWVAPGQPQPVRPAGFVPLPHRWIVERTFAWFLTNRRLVVDFDYLLTSSEARLYLCMMRIMLRRLAKT